jgi:hypothetical protein
MYASQVCVQGVCVDRSSVKGSTHDIQVVVSAKGWNSKKDRKGIDLAHPSALCSHRQSYRDGPTASMPSNDLEEDLLRRFQALRSTPTTTPANPSSSSASFKHISDQQAKKAQEEDEELERIADGRAPASAEKESREGDSAAMEFARRMAKLRGVELEIEEDGEQEVSWNA